MLAPSLTLTALLLPQGPVQGPPPPPQGPPTAEEASLGTQEPLQDQDPTSATEAGDDTIDLRAYWDQGLRFESADRQFRLRIGGRVHLDYSFMSGTGELGHPFSILPPDVEEIEDGSEIRRARLSAMGDIYDEITYRVEIDFSNETARAISVYMGFLHTPLGEVLAGLLKEPMSLERMASSNDNVFIERGLPVVLGSFRSMGIVAIDSLESQRLAWSYGIFGDSQLIEGDSIGEGEYAATARITGLPVYEDDGETLVHLGASGSYRNTSDDMFRVNQKPETHLSPDLMDTGDVIVEDGWIYGVEAATVLGPLSFQAEYLATSGDAAGPDPHLWGYYGFVSYFLTGEHRAYRTDQGRFTRLHPLENFSTKEGGGGGAWEVAARYSYLEFENVATPDNSLTDWSVGVNWYLNPNSRIMANYVQGNPDGLTGTFHGFTLRFQAAF